MRFVDDPDGCEHQPCPDRRGRRERVVQVDLLQRDFATLLAAFELGVFELELGAEGQFLGERVGEVDHEPRDVHLAGRIGPRGIGVVDFTVAADGGAFLLVLRGGLRAAETGEREHAENGEAEQRRQGAHGH